MSKVNQRTPRGSSVTATFISAGGSLQSGAISSRRNQWLKTGPFFIYLSDSCNLLKI
ncbi:hypothetical protein JZ751_018590, partial [Albula glossodonta]